MKNANIGLLTCPNLSPYGSGFPTLLFHLLLSTCYLSCNQGNDLKDKLNLKEWSEETWSKLTIQCVPDIDNEYPLPSIREGKVSRTKREEIEWLLSHRELLGRILDSNEILTGDTTKVLELYDQLPQFVISTKNGEYVLVQFENWTEKGGYTISSHQGIEQWFDQRECINNDDKSLPPHISGIWISTMLIRSKGFKSITYQINLH